MVTSEGYERSELWLRAKRVMVVFNDTPMEEGSGMFFLTAHFVIPVISLLWRKVLECSSSHCSLRHPCDLTHFVIPVISLTPMEEGSGVFFLTLLTSSSLCSHSLRHPCDLTHMEEVSGVFFLTLLTSSSLCSHTHDLSSHPSHRYP